MYLIDTNVASEMGKDDTGDKSLLKWLRTVRADDLFTSVLVPAEMAKGIALIDVRDPRRAEVYRTRLREFERLMTGRLLQINLPIAKTWAELEARKGPLPVIDALLAATALVHGFTLVTRDADDAARTGVKILNPFER